MKKSLLLIAALAATTGAYAQQQAGWLNDSNADIATAWGWDGENWAKDKADRPGGTLIAETENVVLRTAFADNCSASSVNASGFSYYVVNGQAYKKDGNGNNPMQGAVGNTNPPALSNVLDPASIATSTGWVFDYEVKADGWLTVFGKNSSNKPLYVIEGTLNSAGEISANGAVAYFFKMQASKDGYDNISEISFQLPADKDGYLDASAADIDTYVANGAMEWPWNIKMKQLGIAPGEDGKWATPDGKYPSGFGVTIFPVYKDCHYFVFCTGSKLASGPFVWTNEMPTQIAACNASTDDAGVTTYTSFDYVGSYDPAAGAGIDNVATDVKAAELDWNAPVYNVMGQKVSKNFKGIAIQNGAKFVVK